MLFSLGIVQSATSDQIHSTRIYILVALEFWDDCHKICSILFSTRHMTCSCQLILNTISSSLSFNFITLILTFILYPLYNGAINTYNFIVKRYNWEFKKTRFKTLTNEIYIQTIWMVLIRYDWLLKPGHELLSHQYTHQKAYHFCFE